MGLRELFTGITLGAVTILLVWYYEMQLHFGFKIAIAATLSLYLLIPILFHYCSSIQRHLVFLPFVPDVGSLSPKSLVFRYYETVRWPSGVNFSDPETEGLPGTRNIYLEVQKNSKVGIWHMLPKSLLHEARKKPESFWEESLRTSGKPIILYLHGNSGSRAGPHRKELYLLLQDCDSHVISFDYRGYADSTPLPPSETTTVSDGTAVYKWIRKIVGNNSDVKIFIWGHSLGTGVSSHLVANLCAEGDCPVGLILESPFTSIGEEVKHHMLAAIYRYMPLFDYIFIRPLTRNDIAFQSDRHIRNIPIPIAILHAVDDPVVPYFLGQKLYEIGLRTRPSSSKPIYFKGFGEGYAHKFICRAPELPDLVKDFLHCSVLDKWPCKSFDELQ